MSDKQIRPEHKDLRGIVARYWTNDRASAHIDRADLLAHIAWQDAEIARLKEELRESTWRNG